MTVCDIPGQKACGGIPSPGAPGEVELVVTRLDIGRRSVAAAEALLSAGERQRAGQFRLVRERKRFIVARGLLRQLLGCRLGIPPAAVELVYGQYGKPALAGRPHSRLSFNLSHSEGMAAFAFAEGRDIGIDIERIRPVAAADQIAAHFFSSRERAVYRHLADGDRLLGFFNAWTRKEAFIKALGEGLQHALDDFDVTLAPQEPACLQRVGMLPGAVSGWALHSFRPAPGFVGAVVIRQGLDETPPGLLATRIH